MAHDYRPNKTYFEMLRLYKQHKRRDNRLTFFNEGGSRSGKTYDTFDLILDFIRISPRPLKVLVYRETLKLCREKTFADFEGKLLLREGDTCQIFSRQQSPRVEVNGSEICFLGLDDAKSSEGSKSDIVFINEILSGVTKEQFDNVTMRCEMMIIADWNPKFSRHWVFEMEGRPNTFFTRTTFKDNQHINPAVKAGILAFEPTPENILAGTADEYRWKVYGLGERAAQEGVIFDQIEWIDKFPDNLERMTYGLDFGFTKDPTALVRVGFEAPNNIYLEELLYTPISDSNLLYSALEPNIGSKICWADSADKYAKADVGMIEAMLQRGLSLVSVKKHSGSITDGIMIMKSCVLHVVKSVNFEAEALNYTWRKINGIADGAPIDEFNHLWDAARYAVLSEIRHYIKY